MRISPNNLVLSRYFYDNVKFVADMCPKCYEESEDVRIISVNVQFLKQLNDNFYKCITEDFLRFTDEEIEESEDCFENVTNRLYMNEELLRNSEEKCNASNEIENSFNKDFLGITDEEIEESEGCFENFTNCLNKNKDLLRKFEEKCNANTEIENNCDTIRLEYKIDQKTYLGTYNNKMKQKNTYKESKYFIKDHLQTEVDKFDRQSIKQDGSEINENNNNQQTKFISSFLITDFEQKYIEKRKTDLPQLVSTTWFPPPSPHNLIEECLYSDPWALLIATIFLNKTSCLVARPYVFWFLAENPDPLTVLDKFPIEFEKYFLNLGLVRTRAIQVYRMSYDFLFKDWKSVRQLYGIGDYGECAYRMFCLGDFDVEPNDRFLRIYKAWHQKCHK